MLTSKTYSNQRSTKKETPNKTEKQKAGGMEEMFDDDHLTPTKKTTKKQTPKKRDK